jgi:hypothetical protein
VQLDDDLLNVAGLRALMGMRSHRIALDHYCRGADGKARQQQRQPYEESHCSSVRHTD